MKSIIHVIALCLAAAAAIPASAQNEKTVTIEDVTVINDGDGRALYRDAKSEAPLNGLHRIIDGFHSAYILAEFADGFYNGSFETYENSKLTLKGTYAEGRENGPFTAYHPDGKVAAELPFTDGKVDGTSRIYDTDGRIESETTYAAGERNGTSRIFYPDGSLAEEHGYKAGREHGPERKFRQGEDKPYVDRNWFEGKPDGRQYAEIVSNTGDYVEVAHYDKGVPTGEFLQTWADGGEVKRRGGYKDGKMDGVWTEIRLDGKIESETTYARGMRNGPSKEFFTDNTVAKITTYVDDKRNGVEKTFRPGGLPHSEFTFVNDKWEGEYKRYYDEGNIREEGRCKNDYEVYCKEYYGNGRLRRIRERARGGAGWTTLESYDEDGNKL